MKEFLNGKKTIISSIVGTSIGFAYLLDFVTVEQFTALMAIASSFGLYGVRDAMKKLEK